MQVTIRWLLPFLVLGPAQAQELVVNGGFELHQLCPERFDKRPFRGVAATRTIGGTPGYFHTCSEMMGTPSNWAGVQAPYEGDAYAGVVLTAHGGGECAVREFVQLELTEPLINGGKYRLSFMVSLADRSGYMTDRIGASFSAKDRSKEKGFSSAFGRPDVDNPLNRFIADTSGWTKVEGVYNARGGERFVVIGNFQLCDRTSRKAVTPNRGDGLVHNMKRKGGADLDPDKVRGLRRKLLATQAYVYLDAVSLVPIGAHEERSRLSQELACPHDPGRPDAALDLVPDPGFDRTIPAHRSTWKNASGGTPDFEEGRTGIYLYSAVNVDHREYIRTPLKERLDPCGLYEVRLRVLRNATYAYAVDRLGVALTADFENDRRRDLLSFPLCWEMRSKGVMDDTGQWTTLCGHFEGGGCADQLLVGNFSSDDSTTIIQHDPQDGPFAYYFVDDISLWRTGTINGCTATCPEALAAMPLPEDTIVETPRWPWNLHFAVNDHVPGDDLLPVVEELFQVLAAHPDAMVRIEGHTDDTGTAAANLKLSERRAGQVRDELVRLGLARKQLQLVALGSTEPIATNTTDEGRAMNRRVCIVIEGFTP
ncbi:MAG TPA: OmpA family protein [Flavobacteriales bacterium]|nr:OmpA family protein [Flavobacteriales bacterium]